MGNMPLMVQILILAVLMYGLPVAVGGCVHNAMGYPKDNGVIFGWISGQMILWAAFQIVCVPFVLLEMEFVYVVSVFGGVSVLLAAVGCVLSVRGRKKYPQIVLPKAKTRDELLLWCVFGGLFVFQLIQAVVLAYGDGDDAYYVAVSAITENAETMYQKLPYTGGTTQVDIRHGLAPFPIWIAFLARVSGMRAVSVAHVAVPLMLIPMTYGIFGLLGKRLLSGKEKYLPLFLIFTEVLTLFGDYSFYTVEHFMLARSRQGKAALGSIVLPMLLYLMLVLLDKMQAKEKLKGAYWVLLCSLMFVGCLCSTMGAFLLCLMVAITGLCAALSYKRWKVLVPLALCCTPCVCYMLLYVLN